MWGKRSSDEHLGFTPKQPVRREPQPPADEPGSYVDSWYQVLKANSEDEDSELVGEFD